MKIFKNSNLNGSWYSTTFYNKYNNDEIKRFVSCEFPKQNPLPNEDNGALEFDLIAVDKNTGKKYNVLLSAFKRASGEAEPKLVFFEAKENTFVPSTESTYSETIENKVNEFIQDNEIGKSGTLKIQPDDLPFY